MIWSSFGGGGCSWGSCSPSEAFAGPWEQHLEPLYMKRQGSWDAFLKEYGWQADAGSSQSNVATERPHFLKLKTPEEQRDYPEIWCMDA